MQENIIENKALKFELKFAFSFKSKLVRLDITRQGVKGTFSSARKTIMKISFSKFEFQLSFYKFKSCCFKKNRAQMSCISRILLIQVSPFRRNFSESESVPIFFGVDLQFSRMWNIDQKQNTQTTKNQRHRTFYCLFAGC
mgnify:CR=1 FL=1